MRRRPSRGHRPCHGVNRGSRSPADTRLSRKGEHFARGMTNRSGRREPHLIPVTNWTEAIPMPARRDATDIANELYARSFAVSRIAALKMVLTDPLMVTELLLTVDGPEMRHSGDRALRSDNWGPCG